MFYMMLFLIGTVTFRYSLSSVLESHALAMVWIIAVVYFLFNFFIGWVFGKRDYDTLPLYDIGFRFHFATYLLFNSVSVLWFLLGFQSHTENIRISYITAIIWGVFLAIHFVFYMITRKNAILGMKKSEIFE